MRVIRIGICLLVAFAVLAFGGVEPWGVAILEIGAAILLVLWAVLAFRRRFAEIHGNWLYFPLIGLGALGLAQYVGGFSVYPYLTKLSLLQGAAYLVLFFLTLESFQTVEHKKQFLWFLIVFGFLVSLFAIVQHFASDGKLYWIVPPVAGGSPFGPYVNRNHFAGFVELVAPLGFSFLFFRAVRRKHLALLVLFTVVPLGAAILSASRGGIVSLLFELALLAFLSRARHAGKKRLFGTLAVAFLAGAFIMWLGVSAAVRSFERLAPNEISWSLRASINHDAWRIFARHPLVGTGQGTFATVYPRYASSYTGLVVEHAHNDYLELLAESGTIGGLCGLGLVVLLFWRGLGNLRAAGEPSTQAIYAGALTACAGLLLHSFVDFNLHIPANALIFLLLAGIATSDAALVSSIRGSDP